MADLSEFIPDFSTVTTTGKFSFFAIAWFLIFLIVIVLVAVVTYMIIRWLKFKYKIEVWKRVGGRPIKIKTIKAMEVKYGKGGDTVFVTLKPRKILPRPQLQSSKNTYMFLIREDGEWINFEMDDIDMKMKRGRVTFLHPDMRLARSSLQSGFKEEFEKQGFMQKYGHIIVPVILFVIFGLILYFIADKLLQMPDKVLGVLAKQEIIVDKQEAIISKLDNILSNSGIRPVG